jgi:ketopantoate hydroxymethyltransferase
MTNEQVVSVPDMLRVTGENTAEFMKQVADHIEKLESAVKQLEDRIKELEDSTK